MNSSPKLEENKPSLLSSNAANIQKNDMLTEITTPNQDTNVDLLGGFLRKISFSDEEGSDKTVSDYSEARLSNSQSRGSPYFANVERKTKSKSQNTTWGPNNNKNSASKDDPDLFKTEICEKWAISGNCAYGELCRFAHGKSELNNRSRHPKYRTRLCKKFSKTGVCPYGNRCDYLHVYSENGKISSGYKDLTARKPELSDGSFTKAKNIQFNKSPKDKEFSSSNNSFKGLEKNHDNNINTQSRHDLKEPIKKNINNNSAITNNNSSWYQNETLISQNPYAYGVKNSLSISQGNKYLGIGSDRFRIGNFGLNDRLDLSAQRNPIDQNDKHFNDDNILGPLPYGFSRIPKASATKEDSNKNLNELEKRFNDFKDNLGSFQDVRGQSILFNKKIPTNPEISRNEFSLYNHINPIDKKHSPYPSSTVDIISSRSDLQNTKKGSAKLDAAESVTNFVYTPSRYGLSEFIYNSELLASGILGNTINSQEHSGIPRPQNNLQDRLMTLENLNRKYGY
ncbi:Zinc finger protein 36, C3H1 type-like 1 [Smittium mucronatum]|uniref:Zinc finger protein 36, C3H1 type-like 1 n=1 Tax=Smittium mucronatum TaxID=133383 RepID=A0A1R0H6Q2_9FUNG|nr:Zinc finger protein 36, C3H1 type-like 1 [Smittium mucronatum]